MKKRNNIVFIALLVIAWIIFVGLSIDAGGLIVNFIFSVFKPGMVANLYQKLDLSALHEQSSAVYFGMYAFVLFIAMLKATLFYIVVNLMHRINLSKPFSSFASKQITQISYCTLSIGILSHVAREIAKSLQSQGYAVDKLQGFWVDSSAFILMAAVIYMISIIFKKGIELQTENDLTV
jgi:hypothetical protein